MYTVPEPPDVAIPALLPRPIAILSTLARLIPWSAKACSGMRHSVQASIVAAPGSALATTAGAPDALEIATYNGSAALLVMPMSCDCH